MAIGKDKKKSKPEFWKIAQYYIANITVGLASATFHLKDKRERLSAKIPDQRYTTDAYPRIEDKYTDKEVQEAYGRCFGVPGVCLEGTAIYMAEASTSYPVTEKDITAFRDNVAIDLEPGAYRYMVQGARSRTGGTGNGTSTTTNGTGYGNGAEYIGVLKVGYFFHDGGLLVVSVGQNGGNGGSNTGNGNGGGGGAGGCSKLGTVVARGGQAGKGATSALSPAEDGKPANDVFGGSGGNYAGGGSGGNTPPTDATNVTNGYVKIYVLWK